MFDGSGDHRIVSGCDCQRDYEELPGGICTDSDWPFADAVSLDRHSDLQCFTKPGALDCDCAVWRFRSSRLSLVILGSPHLWWRGRRHYRPLAASGAAILMAGQGHLGLPRRLLEILVQCESIRLASASAHKRSTFLVAGRGHQYCNRNFTPLAPPAPGGSYA